MGHALAKHQRLSQIRHFLLIHHEHGSRVREIASALGVAYNSAFRYLNEVGAIPDGQARYRLTPTPEDIELAQAVLKTSTDTRGSILEVRIPPVPAAASQAQQTDLPLTKLQRLEQIKRLLLLNQGKSVRARDLAKGLGIPYRAVWRYLSELGAIPIGRGRYRLLPTSEDMNLAQAVLKAAECRVGKTPKLEVTQPSVEATQAQSAVGGYLTQYRLERAKLFLLCNRANGVCVSDLAGELGIGRSSAWRYLSELGAISDGQARYWLVPTPEDIELAQAVLKITGSTPGSIQPREARQVPASKTQTRPTDFMLTKHQRLGQVKRMLFLNQERGMTTTDLASDLGISRRSVWRYLNDLGASADAEAKYRLMPTSEDIELALAVIEAITTNDTSLKEKRDHD